MNLAMINGHGRFPLFTEGQRFDEYCATTITGRELLHKRMGEIRLTSQQQVKLSLYPEMLNFLLLVGQDDPDTYAVLPILVAMVNSSPRLDLRILTDEMDLTWLSELADDLDAESDLNDLDLPLLLIFDDEWVMRASWGPRPRQVDLKLDAWLEAHPEFEELGDDESAAAQATYTRLLDELTHTMRVWYNSGAMVGCVDEILALLEAIRREDAKGNG